MEELREEYRYFAFISYSHKDMTWAKWIQNKLKTVNSLCIVVEPHASHSTTEYPMMDFEYDDSGKLIAVIPPDGRFPVKV